MVQAAILLLFLFLLISVFSFVQVRALGQGTTADWSKYPYTVKLILANSALCTGCLVTPNVVLTAAHCLEDLEASTVVSNFFDGSKVKAKNIYINPYYTKETGALYDVALIELERNVDIQPVKIQFGILPQLDTSEVVVAGFGLSGTGMFDFSGTFKTGRATVYNRGPVYTATTTYGVNLCDEFQGNLSIFESTRSSCQRCNRLPHCTCNSAGICQADGSPEDVAFLLQGDSGGSVFLLDKEGNITSTVAVNSQTADISEIDYLQENVGDRFSIFTSLSYNQAFIRKTINLINSNSTLDWESNRQFETRPFPLFVNLYAYFLVIILVVISAIVGRLGFGSRKNDSINSSFANSKGLNIEEKNKIEVVVK